jgi:glycosyltransferase involved in cell wall biosynthesis
LKLNKIKKHILLLTSGGRVATTKSPNGGIFMLNQAKILSKEFEKVAFLSTGYVEFRNLFEKDNYQITEKIQELVIWRNYKKHWFPRRYLSYEYQKNIYSKIALKQFAKYISIYGTPDIIHAHNIIFSGIVAEKIYKIYNIPFVITEHSSAFYMNVYSKSFISKIKRDIKNCDLISTVSPNNSSIIKNFFSKKTYVLPNIVEDFFTFKRSNVNSKFEFVCVANLIPMKNVKNVINAFKDVIKDHKARLTIVGDGPLKNEINSLIYKLKIQVNTELIDYLPPNKLSKKLNASNCLILVSEYETFGVVVIEALASGIPVIVSNKVGSNFHINSSNGLIIEKNKHFELVSAMKNIIENYKSFNRRKISEDTINKFGKEAFINNVKTLYDLKW